MSELTPSSVEGVRPDLVAGHVATKVPIATPETTAAEIREMMKGRRFDTIPAVAILQDGLLAGLLRVEDLFAVPEEQPAEQIMDHDPPTVGPGADQEVAAWIAAQHGESTLAVVDEAGRFVGFIPPHRLIAVLLKEHEEDMARLGGFLSGTAIARQASEESVRRRFRHRLPWLLLGLVGAVISADIVGSFEGMLEANVVLAFFLPGIVYMADAVGTQTETLVIRGLSVGVPIGRILRRELVTGGLVGAAVSLTFVPYALLRWGNARIAVVVGLALLAACSTATLAAMSLPWAFQRLGKDPAFGSGPLATVVQDLLSIVIYFAIALILIQ